MIANKTTFSQSENSDDDDDDVADDDDVLVNYIKQLIN